MEQNRLRELENQCIQDCAPPCMSLCPVHVDARQMLKSASSGDFSGAYTVLRKSVPFPEIISRVCDQPCQKKCNRANAGGVIEIAEIEKVCANFGKNSPTKVSRLPKKDIHVAIIGGGLCGCTAAYELARKGYMVTLFEEKSVLGGHLWHYPEKQISRDILTRELQILNEIDIDIQLNTAKNLESIDVEKYSAILLATGQKLHNNKMTVDQVTFQTAEPKVFAGGSILHDPSPILSISDGRRAAISIDRFVQQVSITASRDNEGAYETRLVTNTTADKFEQTVICQNKEKGYSNEEAVKEAARCLQCECMECVKACEYLQQYGSYPKKYVREIYNNLSIIMRTRTANKFINSCTLCGLCGEVCPTDLDMGVVNKEVRQTMVKTKKMPISAHDFALRDMDFSNSERFAGIFLPDGKNEIKDLFFPGCQLAASNPDYVTKIYDDLSRHIPDLGVLLRCCGAAAEWSGETDLFEKSLMEFRDIWESAGKPRITVACSSCDQVLKKNIPEIITIPLIDVLNQYAIQPSNDITRSHFAIHDPCTSRYAEKWQESSRTALNNWGVDYHELKMSRNLTECCGYGGVVWLANPELVKAMVKRRVSEDQADYLTYCVMCRDMFIAEGKHALHILDIIYANDLSKAGSQKHLDYSQRHENRIRVKQALEREFLRKDDFKVETWEKYELEISPEMKLTMESRLILKEDVQKVIEHAVSSKEFFVNQQTGHSLAFYKPNLITYWVEYSLSKGSYTIYDAYSHRMDF